jgi:putative tryptophan/tyrosine transport system substrate-binding protein
MKRRDFIKLVGGAAAWPITALAQQAGKVHQIGFLGGANAVGYAPQMKALRLGLQDFGYVEGKNLVLEERWAEGRYDRLPALAADLVARKVDVIVTQGTPAAIAAKRATTTIPIVMAIVGNPVETGIVSSLSRPGGNITGSSFFWADLVAKRLEIMKEVLPGLSRAAILVNPDNPAMPEMLRVVDARAKAIGVDLRPLNVRRLDEMDAALKVIKPQVEAVNVIEDGLFFANPKPLAELVTGSRLPSIGFREYCEAGGLLAYGVDFPHIWRQAGVLVDKILKGAKPAELPVQQATLFEIVINLATAKTLGITVPPTLLARANEVIE